MNKISLSAAERLGHSILPVLLGLYLTFYPFQQPLLLENSRDFIDFSPLHGLAYPLFISLISAVSEGLYGVVYAQIWLFVLALICLSISIRKIGQANWLGIACIVPIGVTPYVLEPLFSIGATSLFITMTLFMMSFLFSALRRGAFSNLFGFGLMIGICASIESYGLTFLPLILFAAPLIAQNIHCSLTKAFGLPFIAAFGLIALEASAYSTLHGDQESTSMGPKIFAKSALMDTLQATPYAQKDERTRVWEMIEEKLAQSRNEIWQLKNHETRINLIMAQEYEVARYFARAELEEASHQLGKPIEMVQKDIAVSRMVQDPWAYAKLGFDHMRKIWCLSENGSPLILGFWVITFGCILVTLWHIFIGSYVNPFFAAAFLSATAVHLHTLHLAFSGMGMASPLLMLSPLLVLCAGAIIFGFYLAFISPQRTDV